MANLTMAGTKDHPITIGQIAERVRVVWRGRTIGDWPDRDRMVLGPSDSQVRHIRLLGCVHHACPATGLQ